MIVRWGISAFSRLIEDLSIERPLLVTTRRWADIDIPVVHRFDGVLPHAEIDGVHAASDAAASADGLVALGGGSAIDTAKAVSMATGLRVVSIPTTYSGAEWTGSFGMRNPTTKIKEGGTGAKMTAILYETELTLDLPGSETAGTALNALAHCAEALYVTDVTDETATDALTGAGIISSFLPIVLESPRSASDRRALLVGAMHAGSALRAGMGIGHAMAQALGGHFGLAHGTMNAICLPHALRFNLPVASGPIGSLAAAMGTDDAIERVSELASLAGSTRLRDYGVRREELPAVASAAAERPAAKANPRPAPPEAVLELLEAAW
jgi:alcohol dehydrogenase class IV